MENPIAREQIPDSWVEKSRCPYCASAPLWIQHPEGQPDYFVCPTCEMSFNVAQDQPSVFVLEDPIGVTTGYRGQWVEMKTLMQTTQTDRKDTQGKPPQAVEEAMDREPVVEVTPAESAQDDIYRKYPADVIKNAAELYDLGNSKTKIKSVLMSYSRLSEEECDEILAFITHKTTGEKIRSFKVSRWALGIIIVPFLCLLAYGAVIFFQYKTASSVNADADPKTIAVFEYEKLPEFLRNLIPQEVQDVQTPIPLVTKLEPAGGEVSVCPASTEEAAVLFGGDPADWEFRRGQNIWTMQSNYARVVMVPESYLVIIPLINKGLSIQLVPGPAKINNAYILLMRCP